MLLAVLTPAGQCTVVGKRCGVEPQLIVKVGGQSMAHEVHEEQRARVIGGQSNHRIDFMTRHVSDRQGGVASWPDGNDLERLRQQHGDRFLASTTP